MTTSMHRDAWVFEIWHVSEVCKRLVSLPIHLQSVALPSVLSGAVITNDVDASSYSNKVSC